MVVVGCMRPGCKLCQGDRGDSHFVGQQIGVDGVEIDDDAGVEDSSPDSGLRHEVL